MSKDNAAVFSGAYSDSAAGRWSQGGCWSRSLPTMEKCAPSPLGQTSLSPPPPRTWRS
eukprot:CAMPEP_0117652826 /NCGR_PEP_ID=MMETSP0804-20121206/2845_1 /TAXON_ID=1074897 /ORGANISM="Tetraselmis astigmatica, Strain CCMP880" /LENGTH=57 /DNA_ID=CAMNT_0005458921 /DNA_START=190 /DNA_END=363 /DNA_ORIENTATION=-